MKSALTGESKSFNDVQRYISFPLCLVHIYIYIYIYSMMSGRSHRKCRWYIVRIHLPTGVYDSYTPR